MTSARETGGVHPSVCVGGGGGSCGGNTGDSCRKGHGRQAQLRGGCSHGMHGGSRKVDEGWA